MDTRTEQRGKLDWSWLPAAMPRVRKLIADRRREFGDEWVNLCWRRGVIEQLPGWFFAAEGALTLGTPIGAEVVLVFYRQRLKFPDAAMLDIRKPGEGEA